MSTTTTRPSPFRSLPFVTMIVAACAAAAWFVPGAAGALQFDRSGIAAGGWWRVLTGHLTHWTLEHLTWDLVAFVVLGTMVERRSRSVLVLLLTLGAIGISATVWSLAPHLATYRGLSGIDSALFAALAVMMLRDGRTAWPLVCALGGLAAKTVHELATGAALFVAAEGVFEPVPLAHLAGIAAGLAAAIAGSTQRSNAVAVQSTGA